MGKLIDKDALIAEIEKRLKYNSTRAEIDRSAVMAGRGKEDEDILSLLNTLEVKEEDDMTANGYVKYPRKEFL